MALDKHLPVRLLVSIATAALISTVLLIGCGSPGNVDLEAQSGVEICLLTVDDLPPGWEIANGPGPYDLPGRVLPGRAQAGVTVSFFQPEFGARAFNDIFLYSSERKAAGEFKRQQDAVFSSAGRLTPWQEPDLGNLDHSADQFRLACADFETAGKYNICTAMTQYGRFLVVFDTWASPDYMSENDIGRVLSKLDERMQECAVKFADGAYH